MAPQEHVEGFACPTDFHFLILIGEDNIGAP
jgi:hypothetical protein